jgi:hypothetical protein
MSDIPHRMWPLQLVFYASCTGLSSLSLSPPPIDIQQPIPPSNSPETNVTIADTIRSSDELNALSGIPTFPMNSDTNAQYLTDLSKTQEYEKGTYNN